MITLQHSAVYVLALNSKANTTYEFSCRLEKEIPWLLLPDAIRAYTGARQTSHFEELPDKTDVSWMKFPYGKILSELTKENSKEMILMHLSKNTPKCVIGEETRLEVFDSKNYGHPNYHQLRCHLIQDYILDKSLRGLVDVTGRFNDEFIVNSNRTLKLDGKLLREQVALFEKYGFLHLVGKVYEKTGFLLNQEWFDKNVREALLNSDYPKDLAENTYRFMKIPDDIEARINERDFELTKEDKEKIIIADNLEDTLDDMYSLAYQYTWAEL